MGIVFQAFDPHLERLVALKTMLPSLSVNPQAKERFLREARVAAAIKHDHVVTIYHVGEDSGIGFLAMELLEGESLASRLNREGRLPLRDVLRIACETGIGLASAHSNPGLHSARTISRITRGCASGPVQSWLRDLPNGDRPTAFQGWHPHDFDSHRRCHLSSAVAAGTES
jgi:hypothetical protein